MMRTGIVMLVIAHAGMASADFQTEWRDGCPAGNLAHQRDLDVGRFDKSPPYRGTDPTLQGAAPQLDSALLPTRLTLATGYSQFTSSPGPTGDLEPGVTAHLTTAILQGHLNINVGDVDDEHMSAIGITASTSVMGFLPHDVEQASQVGNVVLAIAYRRHWLTTGTEVDRSAHADAADTTSPIEPVSLRHGIAIQLVGAGRRWSDPDAAQPFFARTAFEPALMTPTNGAGGAFETRSEGVGCYAPFIQLRLSVFINRENAPHFTWVMPETLTLGFSASEHFAVLVQYGLLFYFETGKDLQHRFELLGTNIVHRFRFGGEATYAGGSFGFYLDLFRGAPLYHGGVLSLVFSKRFGDVGRKGIR